MQWEGRIKLWFRGHDCDDVVDVAVLIRAGGEIGSDMPILVDIILELVSSAWHIDEGYVLRAVFVHRGLRGPIIPGSRDVYVPTAKIPGKNAGDEDVVVIRWHFRERKQMRERSMTGSVGEARTS